MRMFVAGEWTDGAQQEELRSPYSGAALDTIPVAAVDDVDRALAAAVRGAAKQRRTTGHEREAILVELVRRLRVLLDGHPIGERDFDTQTIGPIRWNLDKAPAGPVTVSFEVTPGFRTDPKSDLMGLSLGSFGFITP